MQKKPVMLSGWLTTPQNRVQIEARYATKYSVIVVLRDIVEIKEISNLELQLEENLLQIGPCRMIREAEGKGDVFHIMPESKFYNFEKMFYRSKIETLEAATLSLPLLIDYKNEIKPGFKEYVSNLTYDLSIYNYLLDQMDSAAGEEPAEIREYIQSMLISGIGADLKDYLDASIERLKEQTQSFTDIEHEHHGYYFRRQLWLTLLQVPSMKRTNLKPRGYSGDSETMRMIYRNDYMGESTFGKVLHKYSTEQHATQSVRNRRDGIAKRLRAFQKRAGIGQEEKLRVLSVACGPAVEIGNIIQSYDDCAKIHFSLLDQDSEALSEAVSFINDIEKKYDTKISIDVIKESVRIMLINPEFTSRWGNFHFIYSMGLFDYFTAPVAAAILKKLYELLPSGGEMVIGNMHVSNPSRLYMEYWHDWKIIYRTEEELMELTTDLKDAQSRVDFDETGIQMFLCIKKERHQC